VFSKELVYETTLGPVILPIEHWNADENGVHADAAGRGSDRDSTLLGLE